jgi:thiol-disulfide isomerase/thioredoxin
MSRRQVLALVAASLAAGLLGLLLSIHRYGPGPLARTPLGRFVAWAGAGDAPAIGAPAPRFALMGLDGTPVHIPPPGRAVLVNYWASWCGPCRKEMPLLSAYAAEQGGNGVQVLGVALEEADAARAFLATRPVVFRSAHELPRANDSSVQLGNARGTLPFTVLIDADGKVRARRVGAFRDGAELRAWVDAAGLPAHGPEPL